MNILRGLFSFRGRVNRTQYFLYSLAAYAVPVTASIILYFTEYEADLQKGDVGAYFAFPLIIGPLWVIFSAMARRFHDINWSAWSCLLIFVPIVGGFTPIIGGLTPIILLFWPGTIGENDYGV